MWTAALLLSAVPIVVELAEVEGVSPDLAMRLEAAISDTVTLVTGRPIERQQSGVPTGVDRDRLRVRILGAPSLIEVVLESSGPGRGGFAVVDLDRYEDGWPVQLRAGLLRLFSTPVGPPLFVPGPKGSARRSPPVSRDRVMPVIFVSGGLVAVTVASVFVSMARSEQSKVVLPGLAPDRHEHLQGRIAAFDSVALVALLAGGMSLAAGILFPILQDAP